MGKMVSRVARKRYVVMDGRANIDMDSAVILDVFMANNDNIALQYLEANFPDMDAVVVRNGEIVYRDE